MTIIFWVEPADNNNQTHAVQIINASEYLNLSRLALGCWLFNSMQIAFPNISSSALLLLRQIFWFWRLLRDCCVTSVCSATCLWAECRHIRSPVTPPCFLQYCIIFTRSIHSLHLHVIIQPLLSLSPCLLGTCFNSFLIHYFHSRHIFMSNSIFTQPLFWFAMYLLVSYSFSTLIHCQHSILSIA